MKNYSEMYDFTLFTVDSNGWKTYVADVYGDELRITVDCNVTWYNLYMNGSVIMSIPDRTGGSVKLVDKSARSVKDDYGTYASAFFRYELCK